MPTSPTENDSPINNMEAALTDLIAALTGRTLDLDAAAVSSFFQLSNTQQTHILNRLRLAGRYDPAETVDMGAVFKLLQTLLG